MEDWFDELFYGWVCPALLIVAVMWVCLSACGCSRVQYVPVETVRTDSVYLHKVERDSVFRLDSVFVDRQGDTVFMERYRYIYKYRNLTDTAYIEKRDTVCVPVPVERELSRWEVTKMHYGGFAIVAVVVTVLAGFGWMVYRLRR